MDELGDETMLSTFIKISSFIILLFCSALYVEDVYIHHQNYNNIKWKNRLDAGYGNK